MSSRDLDLQRKGDGAKLTGPGPGNDPLHSARLGVREVRGKDEGDSAAGSSKDTLRAPLGDHQGHVFVGRRSGRLHAVEPIARAAPGRPGGRRGVGVGDALGPQARPRREPVVGARIREGVVPRAPPASTRRAALGDPQAGCRPTSTADPLRTLVPGGPFPDLTLSLRLGAQDPVGHLRSLPSVCRLVVGGDRRLPR